MYYRAPEGSVCADVIPFYENGEFKLFYLKDSRNVEKYGEGTPWCLLTTKDLVHYVDHGPVLLQGRKEEQDLYVFTGSVFKKTDTYYIFYTGHNPHFVEKGKNQEKILLATSKDLLHWEKVKGFEFGPDESWLEPNDFRDPYVFEYDGSYHMLLAGRMKSDDPINARGVTLIAHSKDLFHWKLDPKPFYEPHAFYTHECPDLFQIGDFWYFAFSEFTDKQLTTYRIGTTPFGPWKCPKVNTFDGHAFYAAKSISDGKRRIMFGWDPIKQDEKDDGSWQWGGTIIPHELVQGQDGTLYVKCPQEILTYYGKEDPFFEKCCFGNAVNKEGNTYHFENEGRNMVAFGKMPTNCRIDFDFKLEDDAGDFGLLLRMVDAHNEYYVLKLDPKMNRLGFDRSPRGNGYLHTEVDVERYCPLTLGTIHHLTAIVEGSVLTSYVDERYALTTRMFDRKEGDWGIYSLNQDVTYSNLTLRTEAEP